MPRAKSWQEAETMLQAKFPSKDVQWRVQRAVKDDTKALVLAYIDARAVHRRLTETLGVENWTTSEPTFHPGGAVTLGIGCRLCVDDPFVWKYNGAEQTDIEAVKGGISDAEKRAASAGWHIGDYLYDLGDTWVELVTDRRDNYHKCKDGKYKYWNTPQLPNWALPEDEKGGGPVGRAIAGGDSQKAGHGATAPPPDVEATKKLVTQELKHIAKSSPDQYTDKAATACKSYQVKAKKEGWLGWLKKEYENHQPAGAGKGESKPADSAPPSEGATSSPAEPSSEAPAAHPLYSDNGAILKKNLETQIAAMEKVPGPATEATVEDIKSALMAYSNDKSGKSLRKKAIKGHWLD